MKPVHITLCFFFAGVILIVSLGFILFGDKGWRDLNAMKQELKALKAENDTLQQENIDLHRRIERLKEDPEFMETIARQELKMIKKDEIVFKFTEDDADKNPTPASPPDITQPDITPPDITKEIPHE